MARDHVGSAIALDGGAMPMADRNDLVEHTGTRGAPQKLDVLRSMQIVAIASALKE